MTKPDITPEAVERLIGRVTALKIVGYHPGGETITQNPGGVEADTIALLRAQSERIAELEDHISDLLVDLPCACGHDNPGDVCLKHMPKFRVAQERIKELEAALDSEHASVGHNIWRFWSDKAREIAAKNTALSARIEAMMQPTPQNDEAKVRAKAEELYREHCQTIPGPPSPPLFSAVRTGPLNRKIQDEFTGKALQLLAGESQKCDAITPQRCAECDCDNGGDECTWIASGNVTAACHDCERPYGHEHGFPDLIIPLGVWERISPSKDDGGLLCPSCICARLHKEGIKCSGAFMSGPIRSIDQDTMYALRWTENLRRTLARIEGDTND